MNTVRGATPSVILLGSKPGAVVALEILLRRGWAVKYVVVPEAPPPAWIGGPTLADVAQRSGVPVVHQRDLPEATRVEFVISYMYRSLVRRRTLQMAHRGAFNFHAAPLPEFAGWAFYNVAILEQRLEYGVTAHWMDEGFDTGPICMQRMFPIASSRETAHSLEAEAQREMILLFDEFCARAETDDVLPRIDQDSHRMRYITQEEFERLRRIPDDADADTVDRYARAFWYPPYDCAWTIANGVRVEIIPSIAKAPVAHELHRRDLKRLRHAAGLRTALTGAGAVMTPQCDPATCNPGKS